MSETTSRLTDEQIAEYRENGFIGVNGVFSMEYAEKLRSATDEFVEQSAELTEHTDVFDLDFAAGHSPETPKLRRIKEPHTRHPVYGDQCKTLPLDDQGGIKGGLDRVWRVGNRESLLRCASRASLAAHKREVLEVLQWSLCTRQRCAKRGC